MSALDTVVPDLPHHPVQQRAQNQRIRHSFNAYIQREPLVESMESHVHAREIITCNFLSPNLGVRIPLSNRRAFRPAYKNRTKIHRRAAHEPLHRLLQEPF